MTPYSIITVFKIGLLLLVMRLISHSLFFILLLLMMLAPGLPCHGSLIFLVTAVFFLSFIEIGIATHGPPSISRLVYIIMILYRLSREWRSPLANIGFL